MTRLLFRPHHLPPSLLSTPRTLHRCLATQTSLSTATITAPPQLPKLIITPGSAHHNSLPSFLEYANRVNLSPERTVYVGTHYEYICALALLRLGFSLLRTGKKSDAGIDLMGHWIMPPLPEPMPVLVQCKARKSGLSPRHVRELEGAFQGIPPEWRRKNVLGLLVTTCKATKGVLEALGGNRWPMAFVMISRTGTIEQFLWNRSATERGLEGVGVTVRHTPRMLLDVAQIEQGMEGEGWVPESKGGKRRRPTKVLVEGTKKDIQLTWKGKPIFPVREGLDKETMRLMGAIAKEVEVVETKSGRKKSATVSKIPMDVTGKKAVTKAVKKTVKKRTPKSDMALATDVPRKRGRPPGSKNKVFATTGHATKEDK